MPTYEYKCLRCKKKFDASQRMSDAPLKKCVHCRGKVERLIGAGGGFIFKGTGFYATDYKKPARESVKPEAQPKEPVKKDKTTEPKKTAEEKK